MIPTSRVITNRSLLHHACWGGNASLVKTLLLKYKADVNARDDDNNTPIHMAAQFWQRRSCHDSTHQNLTATPTSRVITNRSLLHHACWGGNVSLVKTLLLKYKADVNARDDENNTPIHVAALSGKDEVVNDSTHRI